MRVTASDIAERLCTAAADVARLGGDWVDDEREVLTVVEAAQISEVSPETIRRWCGEAKLGRLFAGSLWLISRSRLERYLARRRGRSVVVGLETSTSMPQQSTGMPVRATR
jgi:excisionase family DNA binding protein